ncbi:MAG: LamG domain-containing protein, partial [Candidatus Uhrbacteria bacterium]|nr:LamG domain-containing protein [Candidatus Uhrbacteria bacterium]
MPKLFGLGVLLAKTETVAGVDASPAATEAVQIFDPSFEYVNDTVERGEIAKRSLGPGHTAHSVRLVRFTFDVEMKGANRSGLGDSDVAEPIDALLRACAMTATYSASPLNGRNFGRVSYAPTNRIEPCSIYVYTDGNLHKGLACGGTWSASGSGETAGRIRFEMTGIFQAVTAAAIPTNVEDYYPNTMAIPGTPATAIDWFDTCRLATLMDAKADGVNTSAVAAYDANKIAATQALATCVYDRDNDSMSQNRDWYRSNNSWHTTWGDLPRKIIVAVTAADVQLFSGDDGAAIGTAMTFGAGLFISDTAVPTDVFALNGIIYITTDEGLFTIELINDRFGRYDASGYTYSDITVAEFADACTYANNVAALAIKSVTCKCVHANVVSGETVIGVGFADGWSTINLTDSTCYDFDNGLTYGGTRRIHITQAGYAWVLAQASPSNASYNIVAKTLILTADDLAGAYGSATYPCIALDTGSETASVFRTFQPANGTSMAVLEGASEAESGNDLIVIGTAAYGLYVFHVHSTFSSTQHKRINADRATALMHPTTEFAGLYEEETVGVDCNKKSSNTLTVNGAPAYEADAKFGKALHFDGTDDSLSFANVGSAGDDFRATGSFSIVGWINPDVQTATTQNVFAKHDGATDVAYHMRRETRQLAFYVHDKSASAYIGKKTSATALTAGTWYHFAAVYTAGGTVALYLNGVAQTTAESSGVFVEIEDVATPFTVGSN